MIIYKYPVMAMNQWFELPISDTSKILSFQLQDTIGKRELCIWAISGSNPIWGNKNLIAVGTGIDFKEVGMDGSETFIATAQEDGFVWHLFQK